MSENDVSVPDFQSLMLPCLQVLTDGKARSAQTLYSEIADKMALTETQRSLRHEKRNNFIYQVNINFAASYLFMAGLLDKPGRACFQITEAGQALLEKNPERINSRFLNENYPSFAERQKKWRKPPTEKNNGKENDNTLGAISEEPPEEILEKAHSILCSDLAEELLNQVKNTHWSFFERLVVDLLIRMGYGGSRQDAAKVVGKSGDNGIDGVINEDKLGLDVVYIQAKRYSEPVTISQVRDFSGALDFKKAKKGVFLTTSSFPKSAEEYVAAIDKKIILIDGRRLAELMIEYNVGVAVKEIYEVKRIDYDYFDENEL